MNKKILVKSNIIFDDDKKINKEVESVLCVIKESGAILATSHLSWQESYALVKFAAKKIGIEKIIITHPVYQIVLFFCPLVGLSA